MKHNSWLGGSCTCGSNVRRADDGDVQQLAKTRADILRAFLRAHCVSDVRSSYSVTMQRTDRGSVAQYFTRCISNSSVFPPSLTPRSFNNKSGRVSGSVWGNDSLPDFCLPFTVLLRPDDYNYPSVRCLLRLFRIHIWLNRSK